MLEKLGDAGSAWTSLQAGKRIRKSFRGADAMKPICAMCGRPTMPFVMIGNAAIGPKCARRAGLTPAKAPKGTKLKFLKLKPVREHDPQTLDLFDDYGN